MDTVELPFSIIHKVFLPMPALSHTCSEVSFLRSLASFMFSPNPMRILSNFGKITMVRVVIIPVITNIIASPKLPFKHQKDKYIELPNGRYSLTIRQRCDPGEIDPDAENLTHFEIIAGPVADAHAAGTLITPYVILPSAASYRQTRRMSKELQLGIPTPCTENWSNMSPETNGRFCGACQKTVLDFTTMADNEIIQWFANHGKGSTCGRFRPDQLNRPMATPRENKTYWRYWHYLIAGLLFSSEVSAQNKPTAPPMGQHDLMLGKIKAMPEPQPPTDSIRGRVVDEKGRPLAYASVMYKGSRGTVTNDSGYFSILANQGTLFITAIGYKPLAIAAAQLRTEDQMHQISLIPMETATLGDVMVVAGGVQKKHKPKVDTAAILKDTLIAIGLLPKPLTVYPNPVAKGNQITVSARLDQTGTYTIQLFSMTGTLMQTTQVNGAPKTPKLSMTIPANLTPGTYIVRVSHAALTRSYSEEVVVF
jgi:hypothetical protein